MFRLNPEQEFIVNEACTWYHNSVEQVFQFDGPPGSGKSVILNTIINRLGLDPILEVAAMSYTGAASIVMRMKGLLNAKTCHSTIYDFKEVNMRDQNGAIMMDTLLNVPIKKSIYIPVQNLDPNIKLIVIDEGYTVPYSMKKEIEKFGIKILVAGDQGQLPPVNDKPAYLAEGKIYHLTQVMRQGDRDDIVYISNLARNGISVMNGFYGNSLVIDKNDLNDSMLLWADVVICGTNRTRDALNKHIRELKGYYGNLPHYGEKVVCRKNNWLEAVDMSNGGQINLANGLIGTVMNEPDVSGFDGKMFTMDFKPDIIDVTFKKSRCNYKHIISDYAARDIIRKNKYEVGNMFEFAYAATSYICQGSQWEKVIYIEEPMFPLIQNASNTVGASRATKQLIYVKK